jgi:hypothetical protein
MSKLTLTVTVDVAKVIEALTALILAIAYIVQ